MVLNEQILNELYKRQFLTLSREKTPLERYSRRLQINLVKITNIALLDIESPFQSDLDIFFEVSSASGNGSYLVSLKLLGIVDNLKKYYQLYQQATKNSSIKKSELRKLVQLALRNSLNEKDIRISCTCPDFYYRFSYVATLNNYNFDQFTAQYIPANIRNPQNQGSGCKHCARVLTTTSRWQPQVMTAITDLIIKNPTLLITPN